jgi:hypothetical protein
MIVPGGPAASPACYDPRHQPHRNICTRGRRGRRPSNESVMIMRFDRTSDDRGGPTTLSYVVHELNLGLYLGVKRLMHWA